MTRLSVSRIAPALVAALTVVAVAVGPSAVAAGGIGYCAPYRATDGERYDCGVFLYSGQQVQVTTCGSIVTGAYGAGDTYLYLYFQGSLVESNDDYSCAAGELEHLSYFTYTVPTTGSYQIRQGCFSTGTCSGRVAYNIIDRPCGVRTDCLSCQQNSTCGWCGQYSLQSYRTCREAAAPYVTANGTTTTRPASCAAAQPWSTTQCNALSCGRYGSCTTCVAYANCGWCTGTSSCYLQTTAPASCRFNPNQWRNTTESCSVVDCSALTTCSSCTSSGLNVAQCRWCPATGTCQRATTIAQTCPYGQTTSCSSSSCQYYTTCASCTARSDCGWCNGTKACSSGTMYGPTASYNCPSLGPEWTWMVQNNNTCAADPYTPGSDGGGGLSAGAIVGIVIGSVFAGIALCTVCCIYCCRAANASENGNVSANRAAASAAAANRAAANRANREALAVPLSAAAVPVAPPSPPSARIAARLAARDAAVAAAAAASAAQPSRPMDGVAALFDESPRAASAIQLDMTPAAAPAAAAASAAPPGTVVCEVCRWANPPLYTFCGSCGRQLNGGGAGGSASPRGMTPSAPPAPVYAMPAVLVSPNGGPPGGMPVHAHQQQPPPITFTLGSGGGGGGGGGYGSQPLVVSVVHPASTGGAAPLSVMAVEAPPPFNPDAPPNQSAEDPTRKSGASFANAPPPPYNAQPSGTGAGGRVCPACQLTNEPGYAFCSRCATPLSPAIDGYTA